MSAGEHVTYPSTCYWCSSISSVAEYYAGGGIHLWHVECNNSDCQATGPLCDTRAAAITAWNSRAAETPTCSPERFAGSAGEQIVVTQADRVIEATQIAMGHGKVDVGVIHWQGRSGLLLAPRNAVIPIGAEGTIAGDYWPKSSDVVIWVDAPEGADVIAKEIAPLCSATRASDARMAGMVGANAELERDFAALHADYNRAARLINLMRERWHAVSNELDHIEGGMFAGLEDAASAMATVCDDPDAALAKATEGEKAKPCTCDDAICRIDPACPIHGDDRWAEIQIALETAAANRPEPTP